jgi:hypothetical protein
MMIYSLFERSMPSDLIRRGHRLAVKRVKQKMSASVLIQSEPIVP